MTKEYIERGVLLQKFNPYLDDADTDSLMDGLDAQFVVGVIEDETAADVVEVKHGRWLHNWGDEGYCSKCHRRHIRTNYCPNCGAKMDGE